jgi:hypothetical protein
MDETETRDYHVKQSKPSSEKTFFSHMWKIDPKDIGKHK